MTDSVEARDVIKVIAQHLEEWVLTETAKWRAAYEVDAGLTFAGFTVIRTDPETMEQAIMKMWDAQSLTTAWAGVSFSQEYLQTLVDAALVVLRGDPQHE